MQLQLGPPIVCPQRTLGLLLFPPVLSCCSHTSTHTTGATCSIPFPSVPRYQENWLQRDIDAFQHWTTGQALHEPPPMSTSNTHWDVRGRSSAKKKICAVFLLGEDVNIHDKAWPEKKKLLNILINSVIMWNRSNFASWGRTDGCTLAAWCSSHHLFRLL